MLLAAIFPMLTYCWRWFVKFVWQSVQSVSEGFAIAPPNTQKIPAWMKFFELLVFPFSLTAPHAPDAVTNSITYQNFLRLNPLSLYIGIVPPTPTGWPAAILQAILFPVGEFLDVLIT